MQTLNYNQLAKQKELEERIATLNQARVELTQELRDLGVPVGAEEVLPVENVDSQTLSEELEQVEQYQDETWKWLAEQEVRDLLNQAREGSRYMRLQRRLLANPELVQAKDLAPLQKEQLHYQQQALETFDYLLKYFGQFEVAEMQVALPEAGVRFFEQLAKTIEKRLTQVTTETQRLLTEVEKDQRKLQKDQHREQRTLRNLREQISENGDEQSSLSQVLANNQTYQDLVQEIDLTRVMMTSRFNEVNILIDQTMAFLTEQLAVLESIISQNQATRTILVKLRNLGDAGKTREELVNLVEENLRTFDGRVTQVLTMEIERTYDEIHHGLAPGKFKDLLDEITSFQEYLGQVFADSRQVLLSNGEDLEQKRAEYGRLVLDYLDR